MRKIDLGQGNGALRQNGDLPRHRLNRFASFSLATSTKDSLISDQNQKRFVMAIHQFKTEIDIVATPERVWEVMRDLERWPEWTTSITKMTLLDPQPIALGTRVQVLQPELQPAVWKFTVIEPDKGFEWATGNFMLRMLAGHWITPTASGVKVTLTIDVSGWLGGYVARKYGDLTRQYMGVEARGLKARSEASPR